MFAFILFMNQVPLAIDLILAKLNTVCIYTVPKYISYSKVLIFNSGNTFAFNCFLCSCKSFNDDVITPTSDLFPTQPFVSLFVAWYPNLKLSMECCWDWVAIPPLSFCCYCYLDLKIFVAISVTIWYKRSLSQSRWLQWRRRRDWKWRELYIEGRIIYETIWSSCSGFPSHIFCINADLARGYSAKASVPILVSLMIWNLYLYRQRLRVSKTHMVWEKVGHGLLDSWMLSLQICTLRLHCRHSLK